MMYKNTFKLLFSKFNLVWKLLLYFIIILLVCCGINYLANLIVDNKAIFADVFAQIPKSYENLFNSFDLTRFFLEIERLFTDIFSVIVLHFAEIWPNLLVFMIFSVILPFMLHNYYTIACSNVMNYYMGSCFNFGFTASLCANFWKNIRYQLLSVVTILPLKLVTYYLLIESFLLFSHQEALVRLLAPLIIIVGYILISALRVTLFSGWVPYMVVRNSGVAEGFVKGFMCISKRLPHMFINSICVVITNILLTMFGLLTFGVSLIITIPLCCLLVTIFNMVSFYTATGLRFYVDNSNIHAPKKIEMVESYKIYKHIV